MTKLTVQVEEELLRQFKMRALSERKTVSQIVREFMVWYVQQHKEKA